ncbi:MAG: hypothetical protein AMS15_01395 [Planctomycetes bacterium DG_23]|nr:MAG: hypothetical protein AMS15_01395 [Planctomycetes bacterium DG_23]
MDKKLLMNVIEPEESRVAVLEEGILEEFYVERGRSGHYAGNIYKGIVRKVEPSLQAAFVDFGAQRNGFLHLSEVVPEMGRRRRIFGSAPGDQRRPIQELLRPNQELVVQVNKEGIGEKGAALTTYLSLPGRFLVLMPGTERTGISRKLTEEERQRMKETVEALRVPKGMGIILRTAARDHLKEELERDLDYLLRLWKAVNRRIKKESAPALIYQESDLVIRTIRDIFTTETNEIIVDAEVVYDKVRDFLHMVMPRISTRVRLYQGREPLFHFFKIEAEIEKIYHRRVDLRSGAYLIIEPTEALVAIDVNSGGAKLSDDPEESAFRINLEAAREIARQVRLRDLSGVIINDFIDMRSSNHRRQVERTFAQALTRDRARSRRLRMSLFGIIELTRQRVRPSLKRTLYEECPLCQGTGLLKTTESMSLSVLRQIRSVLLKPQVKELLVTVNSQVASYLQNQRRRDLIALEEDYAKRIIITPDEKFGVEEFSMLCYDEKGQEVAIEENQRR